MKNEFINISDIFYKKIRPTKSQNEKKQITIKTINSMIEVQDIKKELEIPSSDLSLEISIQKRKNKTLTQLDSNVKEILLEGIF